MRSASASSAHILSTHVLVYVQFLLLFTNESGAREILTVPMPNHPPTFTEPQTCTFHKFLNALTASNSS